MKMQWEKAFSTARTLDKPESSIEHKFPHWKSLLW